MLRATAFVFAAGVCLASCAPSPDKACGDQAAAICLKYTECSPTAILHQWGDSQTCQTRYKQACLDNLNAPGTGATPTTVEACSQAYPGYDCESWLLNNPPPACVPQVGKLGTGATCGVPGQCQSTFCSIQAGAQCGVCANLPAVGDSCATTDCGRGLLCADNQVCAAPVFDGGSCGVASPCAPTYDCVGSSTGQNGTCQPLVATVGTSCDPTSQTEATCSQYATLACTGPRGSKTCSAIVYVPGGNVCGFIDGGVVQCEGGATCVPADGGGRFCLPAASDGQPCDTAGGPACQLPSKCVTGGPDAGTAGTCTFPTPTDCQ